MAKKLDDKDKQEIIDEVLEKEPIEDTADLEDEESPEVDDATEEDDAEEEGEEDLGEEPVLDPQVVARARQYGYDDESLGAFQSTEQLESALGATDRWWLAMVQQQQQQPPAQQQQPPPEQVDELKSLLEQLEEDDPSHAVIKTLLKRQEETEARQSQLDQYYQMQMQMEQHRQAQELHNRFYSAFDGLETELYGRSESLTDAQAAARLEAEQTATALLSYEFASGNYQVDLAEVLKRGAHATHAGQLSKERSKPRVDKIRKRSQRRSSVGTRKRTGKVSTSPEERARIRQRPSLSPDLVAEILNEVDLDV